MLRTVLVNLDSDTDRLDWMRGQLHRLKLPFDRFSALRGDHLPEELRRYFVLDSEPRPLTTGEVGCYASHLAIMEALVRDGEPAALVLEDDLELRPHLLDVLAAVERFPADWDIVRLSGHVKTAVWPALPIAPGVELVKYSRVPLGTGAYLISLKGAQRYLAWAGRSRRRHPVDQDLRRVWDCGLATYGVTPTPVEQDVLQRSSIDTIARRPPHAGLRGKLKLRGWGYFFEPFIRPAYNLRFLGVRGWLSTAVIMLAAQLDRRYRRRLRARINGAPRAGTPAAADADAA
ncbi:glycosyltransferase family 25 protein [Caulobacter sp. 17J65-9]|uniref:glycosyltransferase family 25 protein n=1 Tax=Caulobacter sp. 17J65-9 TaxID=2709382 RepID=UPI0013C71A0E|nr:glycosyltransferase family 25 protein [Caulobacter sp. 17J65-9]NEX93555.1 glycosyltransferase family 25 protein [Caulobacter sp. 17J65-9]